LRAPQDFVAAEAATTKRGDGGEFCSGRLRGRTLLAITRPRAERGAKIVVRAFARIGASAALQIH